MGIISQRFKDWQFIQPEKVELDAVVKAATLKIGLAINHIGYLIDDDKLENFKIEADVIQENVLALTKLLDNEDDGELEE